jgi:phosphatidate cytidylyltransferase
MMIFKLIPDTISGIALLMVLLFGGLGIVSLWVWGLRWQGRRAAWGTQILSWWRMFPLIALAWWCWPWGGVALVLLIGGLTLRELGMHSPSPAARNRFHKLAGASICFQVLYALNRPDALGVLVLGCAFMTLMVGAAWGWQVHRKVAEPSKATATHETNEFLLFAVFCYQAAGMWAVAALPAGTPTQAAAWFWWLCILTALNDVAQFVTGKCLGRVINQL